MAVIRIYDGKSFIGEVTEEQIIVTMGICPQPFIGGKRRYHG